MNGRAHGDRAAVGTVRSGWSECFAQDPTSRGKNILAMPDEAPIDYGWASLGDYAKVGDALATGVLVLQ